jgi:hypothetical protein
VPAPEDIHWALARGYVAASYARNPAIADPFRTLGMRALMLASLERWALKTDQFSLVSGASRPTARKLLKIYAATGLAYVVDDAWFASDLMMSALDQPTRALVDQIEQCDWPRTDHADAFSRAVRLGWLRAEYAGTQRLTPVHGRALFSLLRLHLSHHGADRRRIRNVLQDHNAAIGEDLEPELRRWILNGWVETSSEHFFNDRWVALTPLGQRIASDFINLLYDCILEAIRIRPQR